MSPPDKRRARPVCTRPRSSKMYRRHDEYERDPTPNTFGLTDDELGREAARLFRAGWSADEIRAVLDLPGALT